ncbi:MAG: malate/lactate/ureidoglycolate dehydrogenase [Acetobacteraceae bacterium]|nr:malate/lactate/ureidoglycolate dehydrogenase [Acetobacteraceae bacterium]
MPDAVATQLVAAATLTRFVADVFGGAGCDAAEAERISRFLVSANLTGHDSHGVIRVPRYVENIRDGHVVRNQSITVVTESPTHAVIDGNRGIGQTIAPQAVDLGIAKARAAGMAIVALRNCGHVGRIGDWGERAADAGLVAIHFVNVAMGEIVAPYGGVDRRFGTNPFCIAIPSADGAPPLLLDMATSLVAEGKVLVASKGGKPVPEGSMITQDGRLSADPETLYGPLVGGRRVPGAGRGALRAFGEHKGSALAFMCEILAGCLTGGATAGPLPAGRNERITNGMLSIYLDPNHFGSSGFVRNAREYAEYVKASRPAAPGGEVLLPGEPEARTRAARLRDGVPLTPDVWDSLLAAGRSVGVAPAPG